jgi:predicted NAD/FAD-dependent oxidoreductase
LTLEGHRVRVFDKGRRPGGRASTRSTEIGGVEVSFDHGAQYFTVRSPELGARVSDWERDGVVKRWDGRIAVLGAGSVVESYSTQERYVGVPGMSAICQHLAHQQDVRCGVNVGRVEQALRGIEVVDHNGHSLGEFDFALVTAPPQQTEALLCEASPQIAALAASVEMKPCWAVMAAFEPRLEVPFDGAFVNEGPLSWVARTSAKPARTEVPDRWVLHASAAWSKDHLEESADAVATWLMDAGFDALGIPNTKPVWVRAHRWRYALAANPLEDGCLFDAVAGVAACGDWAFGNRIEGAFLSGLAAARHIDEAARLSRS